MGGYDHKNMSSILLQTLARLVGANLGADRVPEAKFSGAANHPYNGSQYILVEMQALWGEP